MYYLSGLNQSFLSDEDPEDLPQAFMPDSVKRLLEVNQVGEQIALVLEVLLSCAPAWSKLACSSASSSSVLALSQLRITGGMILLGWLIRLMIR